MKKTITQSQRQKRIRSKTHGTVDRLRLSVFRSNKFLYAQIIDDEKKHTLLGVSEKHVEGKGSRIERAQLLGKHIATLAVAQKIKQVVFDKGRYMYHGRVKAFAEGARSGGLVF